MAVAKNQIEEIVGVIENRIGKNMLKIILTDLMRAEAYEKNESFRATINRCLARVERLLILAQQKGDRPSD